MRGTGGIPSSTELQPFTRYDACMSGNCCRVRFRVAKATEAWVCGWEKRLSHCNNDVTALYCFLHGIHRHVRREGMQPREVTASLLLSQTLSTMLFNCSMLRLAAHIAV